MNSDEERALFEDHGWEYDYIGRKWVSPVDPEVAVTTDMLVENKSPAFDRDLRLIVEEYGER